MFTFANEIFQPDHQIAKLLMREQYRNNVVTTGKRHRVRDTVRVRVRVRLGASARLHFTPPTFSVKELVISNFSPNLNELHSSVPPISNTNLSTSLKS